ncbi:hypothetical protein [Yunchengibacter salinarum]|uniref:hypothetical protein n=1 Tax=Yunchengibacter salinarum TaxID=3133399 RepID=UPI0035B65683
MTTPLTLPASPAPSHVRLHVVRNQTKVENHSRIAQIQRAPGDRWEGTVTLPPMSADMAADWLGFFDALDGYRGQFRMGHPDHTHIRGSAPDGVGQVDGDGQRGPLIATRGWPADRVALFRRGDLVEIDGRLKRITADVASDGAGRAVVPLAPGFMLSPPDGGAVITTGATGLFRLADGGVQPESDALRHVRVTIAVEEVLP